MWRITASKTRTALDKTGLYVAMQKWPHFIAVSILYIILDNLNQEETSILTKLFSSFALWLVNLSLE